MTRPHAAMIAKLSVSNDLDAEDIRAILALPVRIERREAHAPIVRMGDRPTECCLLSDGYAFRSITTYDGERQILSLHVPGEIPDLQSLHLAVMDHDLTTLTPCVLAFIPHTAIKAMCSARPKSAAALWRETLVDAAIFREWIVNVGSRTGLEKMAHLLCELLYRLEALGWVANDGFELPITQMELGNCLGISEVHANRLIRDLREKGLAHIDRTSFRVLDRARLEEVAQFDPTYLHLAPNV